MTYRNINKFKKITSELLSASVLEKLLCEVYCGSVLAKYFVRVF
jgi:hypothetical protein